MSYHLGIIWYDISYRILMLYKIWDEMISHGIVSYHIMSYHIISYNIISCHVMPCHITTYHITSCHMGTSCLEYELSWARVVLGTSCIGYKLPCVQVVLGTSCIGYELSWVRIVMGTSCLRYELSRCPFKSLLFQKWFFGVLTRLPCVWAYGVTSVEYGHLAD